MSDRVAGLDRNADDYLIKPFAFPKLLAQIQTLLRRDRAETNAHLSLGDLEMDVTAHKITRGGQTLDLTAREFELLEYLLRQKGRLVSRGMLARDVWKQPARGSTLDNVIDVHIARLRKKVDQAFAARCPAGRGLWLARASREGLRPHPADAHNTRPRWPWCSSPTRLVSLFRDSDSRRAVRSHEDVGRPKLRRRTTDAWSGGDGMRAAPASDDEWMATRWLEIWTADGRLVCGKDAQPQPARPHPALAFTAGPGA
jgi:hypothetical protein